MAAGQSSIPIEPHQMRRAAGWFAGMLLVAVGCTDPLVIPEGQSGDPVFGFTGFIDGVAVDMQAGQNGSFLYTQTSSDSLGVVSFEGLLGPWDCDTCSPSLGIQIRSESVENPAPASLLELGPRLFHGPAEVLIPERYVYSFFPLDTLNNLSHFWDFGNGDLSALANPTHTILALENPHQVNHFVTAIGGDTCSAGLSNTVDPASDCSGYFDYQIFSGDHVQFVTNFGPNANISWNFGDGNSGYGANPTHDYDAPGNYLVWMMVMDGDNGCFAQYQRDINVGVSSDCSAAFNYTRTYEPAVLGDGLQLGRVSIVYTRGDGIVFSSKLQHQPETTYFEVLQAEKGETNSAGEATYKLLLRVDALLYSADGDSIRIQSDAFPFAFGAGA